MPTLDVELKVTLNGVSGCSVDKMLGRRHTYNRSGLLPRAQSASQVGACADVDTNARW